MSPEQVTGRCEPDPRTDVYSLGLVLYELLALRPPVLAPSREELLRRIVTKALPPLSRANPAVPRTLEGVVHKATAKDPDERYASAEDFAADLGRFMRGESVFAPPYRYRADEREIVANRPGWMVGMAACYTSLAIVLLCQGGLGLFAGLLNWF